MSRRFWYATGYFCRKFCHADLESREQQAILLPKNGKNQAKIAFFSAFPAKIFILAPFCHAVLDFREHEGLPPD